MFILVSTVSFCIETLPMFDDSYVNKEGFRPLIFYTGIHEPESDDPRTKLTNTVRGTRVKKIWKISDQADRGSLVMRKYLYETISKGTDDEPIWVYDSEILNMKVGSIYQVLVTEIPCFFYKKGSQRTSAVQDTK